MSDFESEEYQSLIQNRGNHTFNENDDSLQEFQIHNSQIIRYQLTSLKKYTHKPKRNSYQKEGLKTQTTKIDSITTFQQKGSTQIFHSPEIGAQTTTQSNMFNSFCFMSEPRGGIVTFLNQQGSSYSITFTDEQLDKVLLIQRRWRMAFKISNELTPLGGIVYLPKTKSKFRSYSEDYHVCFNSKDNKTPLELIKLNPIYITKDNISNYENHVEKFVSSQFKLKSAPKILKAKIMQKKNDLSKTWRDEIFPCDTIRIIIKNIEKTNSIEQMKPLTLYGKNQMTYSIGCNTFTWGDSNKKRNEIDIFIEKRKKDFCINTFQLNIESTLFSWRNKMKIETHNNNHFLSFQLLSSKLNWINSCFVNSIKQYEYTPVIKLILVCNGETVKLNSLKGFQKHKLKYDNGNDSNNNMNILQGLLSIFIQGKERFKKKNIYHDNAFELINHYRKWSSIHRISSQNQMILNQTYFKPKMWNNCNKSFGYNFTIITTKKNWKELSHKINNDYFKYDPIYQKRIWNKSNQKKTYNLFTIEKANKPHNVFFSISSLNATDFEINIGHNQKDIIHTLSKRDIMYLWNKLNRIEHLIIKTELIDMNSKSNALTSALFKQIVIMPYEDNKNEPMTKFKKTESIRKLNTQYTFREDQIMNSDEDEDEIDKIIAICRGDQFTIKRRKKVSLNTKTILYVENIELIEFIKQPKENIVKVQKQLITNSNWNKCNIVDVEVDIVLPSISKSLISNNQMLREYEFERQVSMNIILMSNHRQFIFQNNAIEHNEYIVIVNKKYFELSQSSIMFSIKQNKFNVNTKIVPQQTISFHYAIKKNNYNVNATIDNFRITLAKEKKQIMKTNFSIITIDEFVILGLVKKSFNKKIKNYEKDNFDRFDEEETNYIKYVIKRKWNNENKVINHDLEILSLLFYHNSNSNKLHSIDNDIFVSYNPIKKINQNRTKWDSKIFPVQAQFYKVISRENKWLQVNKIITQNIEVDIQSKYSNHQIQSQTLIQSYSVRTPLFISNLFFELVSPRLIEKERSTKSEIDEIKLFHCNTFDNSLPYSKPQKKTIQKETDVVFNSKSKTSEILINSVTQYKSNGKKVFKK